MEPKTGPELANCTYSVNTSPSPSPSWSTNLCHLITTSSIVGRLLGSCCQQLSRNFHISLVSPACRASPGIFGLSPSETRRATDSFLSSANGTLPVKTSTASIAKENTSPGFVSVIGVPLHPREGLMISGASHLEVPTACGVAIMVKLGWVLKDANP